MSDDRIKELNRLLNEAKPFSDNFKFGGIDGENIKPPKDKAKALKKFVQRWEKALEVGMDYYELMRWAQANDDEKMKKALSDFWHSLGEPMKALRKVEKM